MFLKLSHLQQKLGGATYTGKPRFQTQWAFEKHSVINLADKLGLCEESLQMTLSSETEFTWILLMLPLLV